MNSLLGTALDSSPASMTNAPRLQSSSTSLLGACPQPLLDDQQLQQYSQWFNQSQQYGQNLPSDFEWNIGHNANREFRSSSLLGSLRNEYSNSMQSGVQNNNQNMTPFRSSSSILGSVNAVQDSFSLPQQTQVSRSSHGGIPSLLGPIQPPSTNTSQRFSRNSDFQNYVPPSGSGSGIPSLLGSLSKSNEDSTRQPSCIPSLVDPTPMPRSSDGRSGQNFGVIGGGSILGSASIVNERESRASQLNNQSQNQNTVSSSIPSLLGSLSSLPLMSGQQGSQMVMGHSQRGGQNNPMSLLGDDMDLGLNPRSSILSSMTDEQMYAGGQQQMQQIREEQLQQQQARHMESHRRGGGPGSGFSMAPGGFSMSTSGFAPENSMGTDVYSLNDNPFSMAGNGSYMEPNSTYSMATNNAFSMGPSGAYSMAANGLYSMDNAAHNIGSGGGSGINAPETRCSVLMMNLPVHLGPDELKGTLYNYFLSGPPVDVQVPWAGVARLIFNDVQSAVSLVNRMDGQNLNGHVLRVYVESYNLDQQRMD